MTPASKPYNDGHEHKWVWYTDVPLLKKCYNKTLPNAIWVACCICYVPMATHQAHQARLNKKNE